MLNIYIARHGQNEDNANFILNGHRDKPLTPLGVAQATELAQGIREKGLQFDHVFSSPLIRALATAEIICETLSIPKPIILSGLIERDFGIMTGKRIEDIEVLCAPDIIKAGTVTYFLSPEGAETFPDLLERARKVLAGLMEKYPNGTILLSTHGDLGKMLYASYYHLDWREVLTKFHFGNSELLELSPDSRVEDSHVVRIEQHN